MTGLSYDRIGVTYTATRRPDPRLAEAIWAAVGDAETVLNVGAGTGSYEPPHAEVTAVEPSGVMVAQRTSRVPVVQARAEELPFADASFDVVMTVLSDHHWSDRSQGLRECRRVARRRVVLFNADPGEVELFWLTREYLPGFRRLIAPRYRQAGEWRRELGIDLGELTVTPVPLPHDCRDGFYGAFWRRPEAYLDPAVRAGISVFAQLSAAEVAAGLDGLRLDLASGAWHARHAELLDREELHLGYYVVVAEAVG